MNTTPEYEARIEKARSRRYSELLKIKREGKLIGIQISETNDCGWQYFVYDDVLYSIPSDGNPDRMSIWCEMKNLRRHLIHLQSITNRRWEDDLILIHPELLPQY